MSYVAILLELTSNKQFLTFKWYFHPERSASSYKYFSRKKDLC